MEKEKYCTGYLCPIAENCQHCHNFRNLLQAMKHSVSVMPSHYEDGYCPHYKSLPAGSNSAMVTISGEMDPEVRQGLETLLMEGENLCIYARMPDGENVPVVDIARHKGCPKELFKKVISQLRYQAGK